MATDIILESRAAVGSWPPIRTPAIIRRRGEPLPPTEEAAAVEIHRQPLWVAADWQATIHDLWRDHPNLCPAFFDKLQAAGLMPRCCFFGGRPGEPLIFRHVASPTVRVFGAAWARAQIGKPLESDPHRCYGADVDAQYGEALESGEPIFNRLFITGLPGPPVNYTHLLLGWSLRDGRRALLACIDY